jgi:hypothetical protein
MIPYGKSISLSPVGSLGTKVASQAAISRESRRLRFSFFLDEPNKRFVASVRLDCEILRATGSGL